MPNAETSYRDREAKSQLLLNAVDGFSPDYAPGDSSQTTVNFTTFLNGVNAAVDSA